MFLTIWFGSGVVAAIFNYGIFLAYFQRAWPSIADEGYRDDCGMAACTSLLVFCTWPAVFVSVALSGFCKHGLMYRRPAPQVRKPAFSNKYALPYGKQESEWND